MPRPIEPLHTAAGQRQRAERAARQGTLKLTRKRIEEAMRRYETIKPPQ